MNENDSFIDEVTEEVRRDQLFNLIRKYGWIAVLLVMLLVGGTAYREYARSQEIKAAEQTGDDFIKALQVEDTQERVTALQSINGTADARALAGLLAAADLEGAEAAQILDAIASDGEADALYRDLAALKSVMAQSDTLPAEEQRAMLSGLSQPGAPFRMLALEQLALIDLKSGDQDAALSQYTAIAQDAESTQSLRNRAMAMIVALDGDVEALNIASQ